MFNVLSDVLIILMALLVSWLLVKTAIGDRG